MGISRSVNRVPEALVTVAFLDLLIPQLKVGQNFCSLQCTLHDSPVSGDQLVYLYIDTSL